MDASVSFSKDVERSVVEAALEDALAGIGKVTGVNGSNVELRVDDKAPRDKVLAILREALTLVGVERAKIVINLVEFPFPS